MLDEFHGLFPYLFLILDWTIHINAALKYCPVNGAEYYANKHKKTHINGTFLSHKCVLPSFVAILL